MARLDSPRHPSYPPGCCSARAQLPTAPPAPGFLVAARHWGPLGPSVWLGHCPLLLQVGLHVEPSRRWLRVYLHRGCASSASEVFVCGAHFHLWSPCWSSRPVSLRLAPPWARCPLPKGLTPPAALRGLWGHGEIADPSRRSGGFRFNVPSDVMAFSSPSGQGAAGHLIGARGGRGLGVVQVGPCELAACHCCPAVCCRVPALSPDGAKNPSDGGR